jgi:hypothetical protein
MKASSALPLIAVIVSSSSCSGSGMAASASASGAVPTKASSASSSSSSLLRGSASMPALSVADAGASAPQPGRRGLQVADQTCWVGTGPSEYRTVSCDGNFFATCVQSPVCAGSSQNDAVQDAESCGNKFTVWYNENNPSCPWQHQCC